MSSHQASTLKSCTMQSHNSERCSLITDPANLCELLGSCRGSVAASVLRHTALKEELRVTPETAAELLALADQWCLPQVRFSFNYLKRFALRKYPVTSVRGRHAGRQAPTCNHFLKFSFCDSSSECDISWPWSICFKWCRLWPHIQVIGMSTCWCWAIVKSQNAEAMPV